MGFGDAMRCVSLPFIIDDRSPPLDPIYLQGGERHAARAHVSLSLRSKRHEWGPLALSLS
jgi:hypothetical protein